MVREYCNAFDWDTRTAKPSARRLKELGLDFLVKDVAR
jgi:hypothetical protein